MGFLPFASNGLCHVNGKKNGFAIYATGCGSSVHCTNGIGKKDDLWDLSPKKNSESLMKIEEMADVVLNSANFASHAFLILAPPSGYALKLKALIKVSKVSWTSQLSYEILRYSFERKFDETNFISPKKTPHKSPCL